MISQKRDEQGQHEVPQKPACSAGQVVVNKVALIRLGHKQETKRREKWESNGRKRSEGLGATQNTLKVIYCGGLFSGSTTACCLVPVYRNNDHRSNVRTQYQT